MLPLVLWKLTDDTVRTPQWVFYWTVSFAGFGSLWLSGRLRALRDSPLLAPIAGLLAAVLILPASAFRFSTAVVDSLGIISGLASAVLAILLLGDRRNLGLAAAALVSASLLVCFYALMQYFGIDLYRWAYSYGGQRPFATLGNPNFLGGHMAVVLPIGIGLLLFSRSPGARLLWVCVSFAWALAVALTQTRSAWLAAAASVGWLLWWAWRKRPAEFSAARNALVVLGAAILAAGLLASLRNPGLLQRFVSLSSPDMGQFAKRSASLRAAMLIWRENPISGIGPGNFKHGFGKFMSESMPEGEMPQFSHTYSEEYTHSDPAQFICENGVAGAGLMAWLLVCAVRALTLRAAAGSSVPACLMASWIAFMVHGFFNLPLHIAPTAFLFWAIVGAAGVPVFGKPAKVGEGGEVSAFRVLVAVAVLLAVGVAGARIFASSIYSRSGKDLLHEGKWAESLDAYEKGMKTNWDDRRERFFAASVKFQVGSQKEAIDLFREEIERNPYYMDGFANLGSALGTMGRVSEAEEMLRRAIELNPAYAEAWANLGVALLFQKRSGEAAAVFRRALSLEPTLELAQNGLREAVLSGGGGLQ